MAVYTHAISAVLDTGMAIKPTKCLDRKPHEMALPPRSSRVAAALLRLWRLWTLCFRLFLLLKNRQFSPDKIDGERRHYARVCDGVNMCVSIEAYRSYLSFLIRLEGRDRRSREHLQIKCGGTHLRGVSILSSFLCGTFFPERKYRKIWCNFYATQCVQYVLSQ